MNECFGNWYILNGQLQPADIFESSMVYEGESVYEVLRMVKGLPVFFRDHVGRLEKSVRLQNKKILANAERLKHDIFLLAGRQKKKEINLKVVFNYNKGASAYLIYYIEPIYPSPQQYKKGVKGILYHAERKDPASKVVNHKLRSEIYHKLILENAYEALLVNRDNCITEGSRSNVFFITGNKVYTAPDDAVLGGIIRKHIIAICTEEGIEVEYACPDADRIQDFECAFMSGTSPVVLPFSSINEVSFNVNHWLIPTLRSLCFERAEASMEEFRRGMRR